MTRRFWWRRARSSRWLVLDYWAEGCFPLAPHEKQLHFVSVDPAIHVSEPGGHHGAERSALVPSLIQTWELDSPKRPRPWAGRVPPAFAGVALVGVAAVLPGA